jgi:hypothetical protein
MSNSQNSQEHNYFLTSMKGLLCRPKPATPKEIYAFFHRESSKRQQKQLEHFAVVLELIRLQKSRLGVNWTDPEKILIRDAKIHALAELETDIRSKVTGSDAEMLLIISKLLNSDFPTNIDHRN